MSANYFVKNLWSLDFTGFTGIFHLLSHSIFLIWPHFYHKSLEKYIRLIFLAHFTTTAYGLYHSRYSFRQIYFRHLILHVRLLCNMIVDIHCDLCIWMFFAPLRSVLNGCPPDIQHPITYCITLGLTLFSPSLVHPVWRRVCDEIGGISSGSRFSSSASLLSFLIIGINNVFQKTVHSRRHNRTSMLCIENESTTSTDLHITLQTKHQVQLSLFTERIIYHLCHRNVSDSCIRFGFWIMKTISFITFIIYKLSTYMDLPITRFSVLFSCFSIKFSSDTYISET